MVPNNRCTTDYHLPTSFFFSIGFSEITNLQKIRFFFPLLLLSSFPRKSSGQTINFVQLKGVVIFVSAVVYNEAQENSAALSHIQLCVTL